MGVDIRPLRSEDSGPHSEETDNDVDQSGDVETASGSEVNYSRSSMANYAAGENEGVCKASRMGTGDANPDV